MFGRLIGTVVRRAAVLFIITVLVTGAVTISCNSEDTEITDTTHTDIVDTDTAVISIVGDIMLSRGVQDYTSYYGYDYPYENVKEIFLEDDLTIANLECVLSDKEDNPYPDKSIVFKADSKNAEALKKAGIDCVSLANNHTYDYMYYGLEDTIKNLEENDIGYIGTIDTYAGEESNSEIIYEVNGIKIGLLAYCMFPTEENYDKYDEIKIKYITETDTESMEHDIKNSEGDFIIVYFHWGEEYFTKPNEIQESIARLAIDAGADFIVGSHPHVQQSAEVYNDRYIFYSIGNFIFDVQFRNGTDKTEILQLEIDKNGLINVNEIPFNIIKSKVVPRAVGK